MNTQPLVSICLATYNHENYIQECIHSLLNQDYKNIEVCVVDDGSSDKTYEKLVQIKDPRLKILTQRNQGPSVAINNAILLARGDYIATFSGDDVAYKHKISSSLNFLLNSKSDLIFGLPDIIDENNEKYDSKNFPVFFGKNFDNSADFLKHLFYGGNFVCASASLAKKQVYDKIGLFNPASLQLQDFEMWIKAAKHFKVSLFDNRTTQYRVLSSQRNLSSTKNDVRMYFELMMIYEDFFKGISKELFVQVFKDEEFYTKIQNEDELELEASFKFLKHGLNEIKSVGLRRLFHQLQVDRLKPILLEEFEIVNKDFFNMTNEIDFMNRRITEEVRNTPKELWKKILFSIWKKGLGPVLNRLRSKSLRF